MMTKPNPRPSRLRKSKFYIGIIIVAALVLSSWYGASYYLQQLYTKPATKTAGGTASLNLLFNYGNGTLGWSNSTNLPAGWTLYEATASLATVDATNNPSYGHLVNSINGVRSSGQSYWLIWIHCAKDHAWMFSQWGVDALKPTTNGLSAQNSLHNPILLFSDAVAWTYGGSDSTSPVPGAAKVDFCSS
jgi:hypothetical protein